MNKNKLKTLMMMIKFTAAIVSKLSLVYEKLNWRREGGATYISQKTKTKQNETGINMNIDAHF